MSTDAHQNTAHHELYMMSLDMKMPQTSISDLTMPETSIETHKTEASAHGAMTNAQAAG